MPSGISGRVPTLRLFASVAVVVTSVGLAAPQAGAASGTDDSTSYAPAVLPVAGHALAGSTGITPAEAERRIGAQEAQAALADRLTAALGDRAAGAYFDDATGELVVNVVDRAGADTVRAAGATPKVVERSEAELTSIVSALNRHAGPANTAWGIDTAANQVVLTFGENVTRADVARLLAVAGRYGEAVRVERTSDSFDPLLRGGEAIYRSGGGRCSAGFNVTGSRVLTAGHCTRGYPTWYVSSGALLGRTIHSSFPGNDYGLIGNDGGVSQPGVVYLYNGRSQDITRSANPYVGQSVCKSGSTTRLTCGTVRRLNVTVNYGGGNVVYGLAESNACADRGDSGGSWFSGRTALGLTSGGNLVCGGSTRTFFQPVVEALNRYRARVY